MTDRIMTICDGDHDDVQGYLTRQQGALLASIHATTAAAAAGLGLKETAIFYEGLSYGVLRAPAKGEARSWLAGWCGAAKEGVV